MQLLIEVLDISYWFWKLDIHMRYVCMFVTIASLDKPARLRFCIGQTRPKKASEMHVAPRIFSSTFIQCHPLLGNFFLWETFLNEGLCFWGPLVFCECLKLEVGLAGLNMDGNL